MRSALTLVAVPRLLVGTRYPWWWTQGASSSPWRSVRTASNWPRWGQRRGGVFRSDDGGQHFRQVFASKGNCYRMGARGKAVAVACAPVGQVLADAEDGEKFQVVPVLDAAGRGGAGGSQEEVLPRARTR
jgi:hypothetical protein